VRLAYPLADIAIATSHVTRMLGLALILAIVVAVAISALLTKFLLHSATIISSVAN